MWEVCSCRVFLCYHIFIEVWLGGNISLASLIFLILDLWVAKVRTRHATLRTFKRWCATFVCIPWILFASSTRTWEWRIFWCLRLHFENTSLFEVRAWTQRIVIWFLELKWGGLFMARRPRNFDYWPVFHLFNARLWAQQVFNRLSMRSEIRTQTVFAF